MYIHIHIHINMICERKYLKILNCKKKDIDILSQENLIHSLLSTQIFQIHWYKLTTTSRYQTCNKFFMNYFREMHFLIIWVFTIILITLSKVFTFLFYDFFCVWLKVVFMTLYVKSTLKIDSVKILSMIMNLNIVSLKTLSSIFVA